MFCRSCGKQLNDEAVFCGGCGTQVKAQDPVGAGAQDEPAPAVGQELPVAPEAPSEPTAADPYADVTAPMPQVPYVPAAVDAVPQPTYPVVQPVQPKRSNTGLIIALVVVGLVVVGAAVVAGLYFTGFFEGATASRTRTDTATARGDLSAEEDATGASEEPDQAEPESDGPALDADASYDLIVEHYIQLDELSAQVGKANADGSYGGTGFAYDVFNKSIGSADINVRKKLVTQCQEMLDTVSGQKQTLDSEALVPAYTSQKQELLGLYELLEKRMQAMLGAAEAAVSDPSESSWRPILSPASTESREEFESRYPGAEPFRQ